MCTPEASEYIHGHVASSRLAALAPAKHMGLMEHNQQFAELVATFATDALRAEPSLDVREAGR